MRIFIDTSRRKTVIGIREGNKFRVKFFNNFNELPLYIHEGLEGDIELIGITIGPGSFTGIRNGIAFVKAFTLKGIKVLGFNTLKAAFKCCDEKYDIFIMPSRRDRFFVGLQDREEEWTYDKLKDFLADNPDIKIISTDNIDMLSDKKVTVLQDIIVKGMDRWSLETLNDSDFPLLPFYLHS